MKLKQKHLYQIYTESERGRQLAFIIAKQSKTYEKYGVLKKRVK